MACRDCEFLRVLPDKDGKRRPRRERAYTCTVEVPLPKLPMSVISYFSFGWPPEKKYMSPDDGDGCVFYKQMSVTKGDRNGD